MQPTPIPAQPLSYETATEDFRPIVKVLAWSAIATGFLNLGWGGISIYHARGDLYLGDFFYGFRVIVELLIVPISAALAVSGIMSLRPGRAAGLLLWYSNLALLSWHVVGTGVGMWDMFRNRPFNIPLTPTLVAQALFGKVSFWVFPATIVLLLTRPPIRRAFER